MALVQQWFELAVQIIDSAGDTSTKTLRMTATDAATATTDAADILPKLQAMTDGIVVGYKLSQVFAEDNLVLPADGVEVENQAVLVYELDSSPLKSATDVIPAAKPEIFVALTGDNRNVVDLANLDVLAWRDLYQAGGTASLTISDGEAIARVRRGYRRHKKSRRG